MKIWSTKNFLAAAALGLSATATTLAGGPNVAIVAAAASSQTAGQFVDPQAKLMATGLFNSVDIINAGAITPTLAQLKKYDAIITWSNVNYANAVALGNVLADYVDAGGGVVVATFANSTTNTSRFLQGRWITDGYEIIPNSGGSTSTAASLGTILIPDHPIMQGVNTLSGTNINRPTTTAVTSHGLKVALWNDGRTLVAVSTLFPNRVDLGLYPPSSAVSSGWWQGDGAILMANALLYSIPAPGALPLLAGALLCSRRRRRG